MKELKPWVKFLDDLPLIGKIIFALPGIDGIAYGLYRIGKGRLIVGLLWIFLGFAILWIIDLVSIILNGKVSFLA